MMAAGFKPVGWVAAVAAAALGCYMLSLNVAAERAELAEIERKIIAAKQDIRSLQTELGTRGRLAQLDHWNAEVLALSAPSSAQFLPDEFTLARFDQRPKTIEDKAKVQLASAEAAPAPLARPGNGPGNADASPGTPGAARPIQAVATTSETGSAPVLRRAAADASAPVVRKASIQSVPAAPQLRQELGAGSGPKPATTPRPAARPVRQAKLLDDGLVGEITRAAGSEQDGAGRTDDNHNGKKKADPAQ